MKTANARRPAPSLACLGLLLGLLLTGTLRAVDPTPESLTSRLYVAESEGKSSINTGTKIEPLTPKSAYAAQGATLETQSTGRLGLVLSNGTGLALIAETSLQITRFQQDRFVAKRTDLDAEPSISHFEAMLVQGGLAISCTKLSEGSTMSVKTPLASMMIVGGKLFIETTDIQTKVTVLEGNTTIHDDLKGTAVALTAGQQAIITRPAPSLPAIIKLIPIEERNIQLTKDAVDLSTMARRTVYFDVVQPGAPGEELVSVRILPGTIPGPNTVSPFRITRTVIR